MNQNVRCPKCDLTQSTQAACTQCGTALPGGTGSAPVLSHPPGGVLAFVRRRAILVSVLAVVLVGAGLFLFGKAPQFVPPRPSLPFEIVARSDESVPGARRVLFRARIPRTATREELREVGLALVAQERRAGAVGAVRVFFYLPDTDSAAEFTGGKFDWGPQGDWEAADRARPGDYSGHGFTITTERAFVNLPQVTRMRIFREVIIEEERGDGSPGAVFRARAEVAKRWGITPDDVGSISMEGLREKWTMPPRGAIRLE